MPKHYNQGLKMLLIRDYLYENTKYDGVKEHVAHVEDILEFLEEKEIQAERKTIYHDVQSLREDADVPVITDKHCNGYVITKPKFSQEELRLMVDSIQSAKFITSDAADEITKKIKTLTDKFSRRELDRTALVANRVRSMNGSVVNQTHKFYEAIAANKKIAFKYFHYSFGEEKKQYSKEGERYIVSPFALYWNNANLYLYAYVSEKQDFRYFRVDRMERISEPLLEPRDKEGIAEYEKAHPRISYTSKDAVIFDMFSGKETNVSLRCFNRLADAVYDKFPSVGIVIPDGKDYSIVNVKVQLSPPFYAWVATFGKQMKIVGDKNAIAGMKEFLEKSYSMYNEEEKE